MQCSKIKIDNYLKAVRFRQNCICSDQVHCRSKSVAKHAQVAFDDHACLLTQTKNTSGYFDNTGNVKFNLSLPVNSYLVETEGLGYLKKPSQLCGVEPHPPTYESCNE